MKTMGIHMMWYAGCDWGGIKQGVWHRALFLVAHPPGLYACRILCTVMLRCAIGACTRGCFLPMWTISSCCLRAPAYSRYVCHHMCGSQRTYKSTCTFYCNNVCKHSTTISTTAQLTVQGSQCGDYFANASLLQFHRNNVYCDANAPTLAQIANHQQNGTILEARHLQCAHKQHQDAKPRFLVAADATGAVGAAYATVFDWAAASARWVPASCASVAHLLNMRGEHTWAAPEGEGATEERAWMWVLQEVVGE